MKYQIFIFPGETVLGEIRKKADTPVIGISAKTDIDSRINLIKNGADDYLVKPFDNAELLLFRILWYQP